MSRYVCTYVTNFNNPFDRRRLILLIKALSKDEALKIAMNRVKDSDKDGWNISEVVESENRPIEAVIVVGG